MNRLLRALVMGAMAFMALPALAHKASDAYLQVVPREDGVRVRWDIALRDLDAALSLDADGDRALTWGEVRTALPRIEAFVRQMYVESINDDARFIKMADEAASRTE